MTKKKKSIPDQQWIDHYKGIVNQFKVELNNDNLSTIQLSTISRHITQINVMIDERERRLQIPTLTVK